VDAGVSFGLETIPVVLARRGSVPESRSGEAPDHGGGARAGDGGGRVPEGLRVLDESPRAYKDIDAVMAAQADLVDVAATLKQVLCVKG